MILNVGSAALKCQKNVHPEMVSKLPSLDGFVSEALLSSVAWTHRWVRQLLWLQL